MRELLTIGRRDLLKMWAIVARDVKEYSILLGMQITIPGLWGVLSVSFSGPREFPAPLFIALVLGLNLPIVLVLPALLIVREKNRGVWGWLLNITGRRMILLGAKFVIFSGVCLLAALGQWPMWKGAQLPWSGDLRFGLWRFTHEVLWAVGCLMFLAASISRGSLKAMLILIVGLFESIGLFFMFAALKRPLEMERALSRLLLETSYLGTWWEALMFLLVGSVTVVVSAWRDRSNE
jgi:hypothetical protein